MFPHAFYSPPPTHVCITEVTSVLYAMTNGVYHPTSPLEPDVCCLMALSGFIPFTNE